MKKILLVGNPNVGKSALFSRLTGIDVITSNYPGTTVGFTKGYLTISGEKIEIIDIPGVYTLEPNSKVEEVAIDMLNKGCDVLINVVDATSLERNLNLTLQLLKYNIPVIIALNFWDETRHFGVSIDMKELEKVLGVPVIPTCAITGEGIKELINRFPEAKVKGYEYKLEEKWKEIGNIVNRVQKLSHRHHTFLDKIEEVSTHPLTGIPFALVVLVVTFLIVRFVGEGLINYILDPIFKNFYHPAIINIVDKILPFEFLRNLLLGTTSEVMESFGLLTTGIYIPLVIVLPYMFSFYLMLSFLEDTGYLPRVAVLLDSLLHKIGLHGYGAIPVLLGFGCKVPAMLSTRLLETNREKIIATALILMIAPCMPQTAMIISLVAPYGIKYLLLIFLILCLIAVLTGFFLNKILKGETPELFVEIPPYRVPYMPMVMKKLWIRLKAFILEAMPLIIVGIFIVGILDSLGVTSFIANFLGKPILSILGLPKETISVMLLGVLRKDVSIALLAPYHLSIKQLMIASIFMVLYLPCIATFFTMSRELGIKNTLKIVFIMFFTSIILGALLNLIL
ncbi:MAG: ferrous iron transporter B [bacterium]